MANWTLVESDQQHAVFRHALADLGLEVTKTYRLAEVPEEAIKDNDWQPHKSYHLEFDIQVRNVGQKPRKLAYRLDGPSGLPHEGVWYASKVSFTWGAAGLRDVVSQREHTNAAMKTCSEIADKGMIELDQNKFPYQFLGVDAQYFSALLLPDEQAASEIERAYAIRVGAVEKVRKDVDQHQRAAGKQGPGGGAGQDDRGPLHALCRAQEARRSCRNTEQATSSPTAGTAGSPAP